MGWFKGRSSKSGTPHGSESTPPNSGIENGFADTSAPQKRRTILWVSGWLFCFPIPLTILMLKSRRTQHVNKALKAITVAAGWILYFILYFIMFSSASAAPHLSVNITSKDFESTPVQVQITGVTDDNEEIYEIETVKVNESTSIPKIKPGTYTITVYAHNLNQSDADSYKANPDEQQITFDGKQSAVARFELLNDKEAAQAP